MEERRQTPSLTDADVRWLRSEFDSVRQAIANHTHPGYSEDDGKLRDEIDALNMRVWMAVGGLSVIVFIIEIASRFLPAQFPH